MLASTRARAARRRDHGHGAGESDADARARLSAPLPPAGQAGTRVVHALREPYEVYIGRASPRYGLPQSPFANPFKIGRDGDRATVIAKYRAWLLGQPALLTRLPELRGKVLGCWCKQLTRDIPCHGDVLVELLEEAPCENTS